MATDSGEPIRQPAGPDIWQLPDILDVDVRPRRFTHPRRVTTAGVDRSYETAVEIAVTLSEPFTTRALGPVLWVGDQPLTIAEADDDTHWRFLAFEPGVLRRDAPITLSWNSPAAPRKETRFRYPATPESSAE